MATVRAGEMNSFLVKVGAKRYRVHFGMNPILSALSAPRVYRERSKAECRRNPMFDSLVTATKSERKEALLALAQQRWKF
jgi:hypothetical protein